MIQELINLWITKSANAFFPLPPFGHFLNRQDQRKMKLKSNEYLLAIFRLFKLIYKIGYLIFASGILGEIAVFCAVLPSP